LERVRNSTDAVPDVEIAPSCCPEASRISSRSERASFEVITMPWAEGWTANRELFRWMRAIPAVPLEACCQAVYSSELIADEGAVASNPAASATLQRIFGLVLAARAAIEASWIRSVVLLAEV